MATRITYPKCPYCKNEYREGITKPLQRFNLLHLAQFGYVTEKIVECWDCKKKFKVKVHINYFSSKIKERGGK